MTTKPLNQNGDRYKKIDNGWQVSATASIQPLTLTKGKEPDLVPLLAADGVIVKLYDTYLVSKNTLDLINKGENPHYDIVQNGSVKVKGKDVTIGKTIPVININVDGLISSGSQRDRVDIYAGVKGVEYNYLTEKVQGVPKGLLDQINYTIGNIDRPADTFSIFDLKGSLNGDYSIDTLKIETTQASGSLDKAKLQKFMQGVSDRLVILRNDFNSIKDTFYNGKVPNTPNAFQYTKVATTDDSQETIDQKQSNPVVIKNTSFVKLEDTPLSKVSQVNETKLTDLSVKTDTIVSSTTNLSTQLEQTKQLERQAAAGSSLAISQLQALYNEQQKTIKALNK